MALKDMLGNLVGSFVEKGAAIADEFTLSKEEREQFRQMDEARTAELQKALWDTVQARYDQVKGVIQAEMAQGDAFTKRARPSIVYAGLFMHLVKMLGSPWYEFAIDPAFTTAWAGVCGVWIVGRTAEKIKANGTAGRVAGLVTGSGASGIPDL